MPTVSFVKMQGSGNDFIMIDNRNRVMPDADKVAFVKKYCPRALGIGADGVIFLEKDAELDFRWDFYNADGSVAEMCGNGSRCVAVFAHALGAAGKSMTFRTLAGPIRAELAAGGARVRLTDATLPEKIAGLDVAGCLMDVFFLNTGVPHAVAPVADLEKVDIRKAGHAIRFHARFAPKGTNANFMVKDGPDQIAIRTYERGVEDETLACGTGSVASAIVAANLFGMKSPVRVRTRSGVLLGISFRPTPTGVSDVFLEGPVERVFAGQVDWTR